MESKESYLQPALDIVRSSLEAEPLGAVWSLSSSRLLIPAAFPGSIPSAQFWVFQGLPWQRWVQFKVFLAIPEAWGAVLVLNSAVTLFLQHTMGSPMGVSCCPLPRAGTVSCCGHLPWNPTPLHCPAGLELGKLQPALTRLFCIPARLPARHFILIFFVLGHVHRREDKLLKTMWISAYFNPGQPD